MARLKVPPLGKPTKEEIEQEKAEFRKFIKKWQKQTGGSFHAACLAWKQHLLDERAAAALKKRQDSPGQKLHTLYADPEFRKYMRGY